MKRVFIGITVGISLVMAGSAQSYDRITGQEFASRSEVIAQTAMAATSQPLATQIALDIMRQGGNAIDAAIAANAALGLMEPTGNGIGGDLYAIVWSAKDKKLYGLNASGRSPKGLTLEQLQAEVKKLGRTDIPPLGMLPISVPTRHGHHRLIQRQGFEGVGIDLLACCLRLQAPGGLLQIDLVRILCTAGGRCKQVGTNQHGQPDVLRIRASDQFVAP